MASVAVKKIVDSGIRREFAKQHAEPRAILVKQDTVQAQAPAVPEGEMTSPDFEAFMSQYGKWSEFA